MNARRKAAIESSAINLIRMSTSKLVDDTRSIPTRPPVCRPIVATATIAEILEARSEK